MPFKSCIENLDLEQPENYAHYVQRLHEARRHLGWVVIGDEGARLRRELSMQNRDNLTLVLQVHDELNWLVRTSPAAASDLLQCMVEYDSPYVRNIAGYRSLYALHLDSWDRILLQEPPPAQLIDITA